MNKSAGTDSMQGEHFKYAHSRVTGLLSMLFIAMFLHNYLPCKLMEIIIVLIIKNSVLLQTDNYRPIAITSVVSKILELLLLDRLQFQLETSSNQFEFKSKHGIDGCVHSREDNRIL